MHYNISDSQALFSSFVLIIFMVSLDTLLLCSVGQQASLCSQLVQCFRSDKINLIKKRGNVLLPKKSRKVELRKKYFLRMLSIPILNYKFPSFSKEIKKTPYCHSIRNMIWLDHLGLHKYHGGRHQKRINCHLKLQFVHRLLFSQFHY